MPGKTMPRPHAICVDGLVDFLPDAYLETDPAGVILAANAALSRLVGFARGYAVGKPVTALVHASAADAVRERAARAAENDRVQVFEATLRPVRTGAPRQVRAWLAPLRDPDGALVGLRWLLRDVTDEVETAAWLARLEAEHARELRTRTIELEATVRFLRAQLPDNRAGADIAAGASAPDPNGATSSG